MGPPLFADVFNIELFMKHVIKKDVMAEAKTIKQPSQIDVS